MGFWHTGYIEFHEPVGLGEWRPTPPVFRCAHCASVFATREALRDHRFQAHPLRRPLLFLKGNEAGTQPIRITKQLDPGDIRVEQCDGAAINGTQLAPANVAQALARVTSDVVRVTLERHGVRAVFELDFRVASQSDLEGVEREFQRTAIARRLDTRAVDEFIAATSPFGSAIGYCDGICAYLYGVLAKERTGGSSLPQEAYAGKLSKAAEELIAYDCRLARTIGALVAFHFNHFEDAVSLAPAGSRVAGVASRYVRWLGPRDGASRRRSTAAQSSESLEALVTDWDTEQILRHASRPSVGLVGHTDDVEAFLKRELAEFDRVKVRVLLAEAYAAAGDAARARQHVKALWNVPALERWSENMMLSLPQASA